MLEYEKLEVWKRAVALSVQIYKSVKDLRDFGYRDQITRASLSVPSNVAEGVERGLNKECIRFLIYAKGSCGELRTQILIGKEIGYFEEKIALDLMQEAKEICSMLGGLVRTKRNFISESESANIKSRSSRLNPHTLQ